MPSKGEVFSKRITNREWVILAPVGFFWKNLLGFSRSKLLRSTIFVAAKESKSVLKLKVNTREIKLSDNFRGGNRGHTQT